MIVFNELWRAEIERRFANRPRYERANTLYHIVTSPKYEWLRHEIETYLDSLTTEAQQHYQARMQTAKSINQFIESYHELVVYDLFRQHPDYSAIREVDYGNKTPDWLVIPKSGPEFILEVRTINQSSRFRQIDKAWGYLRLRLQEIELPFLLSIHHQAENPPDSRLSSRIVKDIRRWLEDDGINLGERREFGGIEFELAHVSETFSRVQVVEPVRTFWVNHKLLQKKILDKASKYKEVVEKYEMPYVIALVPMFSTGYDVENFAEAFYGHLEVILESNSQGNVVGGKETYGSDGLFGNRILER